MTLLPEKLEIIRKHNQLYRDGIPEISDEEYDNMLYGVEKEMTKESFIQFKNSLAEKPGDVKLNYIVGSLDKLKYEEPDKFFKWLIREKIKELFISAKIDGCSFVASYFNHLLISCSSKGDGDEGTDWLDKARHILPNRIVYEGPLDIRGEFTLTEDSHEELGFKNRRNGTVGIMNRDTIDDSINHVKAYTYQVLNYNWNIYDQFNFLKKYFQVAAWFNPMVKATDKSLVEILKNIYIDMKVNLPYDIDGLVMSAPDWKNENDQFCPKGKISFKVNSEGYESIVLQMEDNVGKQRNITPVAIIQPIEIDGSTVSRVSCYNYKEVVTRGIGIGAKVLVIKSGAIIPKIIKVVERVNAITPTVCPECGSRIEWDENQVQLMCINELCGELKRVTYFIKTIGIEFVSDKRLKEWGINTFDNLLKFYPDSKYKSQIDFYNSLLDKVFRNNKINIIRSFSCKNLGTTNFDKLLEYHNGDLPSVMAMFHSLYYSPVNFDERKLPQGIGILTLLNATNDWFNNMEIFRMIMEDERYREPKQEIKIVKELSSNKLKGTFLLTGTLSQSRKYFEELIKDNGGEIISSVSKNLNYLLVGIDAGSKLDKAKKISSIKIINEKQFMDMIN